MFTSLVNIIDSRPDLQAAIRQGLNINDWWETNGVNEYPGVTLVPPGDPRIQDPRTLTVEVQQGRRFAEISPPPTAVGPASVQTPTGQTFITPAAQKPQTEEETFIQGLQRMIEELQRQNRVINPNVEITPETAARFLKQAETDPTLEIFRQKAAQEIDPFFTERLRTVRESLLSQAGFTSREILEQESQLEREFGLRRREIGEEAAERGLARSGRRELSERELAEATQRQIERGRRTLGERTQEAGLRFAEQFGTPAFRELRGFATIPTAPRVGRELFERTGAETPFFELPEQLVGEITGEEEFRRRGEIRRRAGELEAGVRGLAEAEARRLTR